MIAVRLEQIGGQFKQAIGRVDLLKAEMFWVAKHRAETNENLVMQLTLCI